MPGYENLACELVDKKCTAYEDCALDGMGTYSCTEKGRFSQLAAFFSEGGSSDTPLWIWITVGVGGFLLILVLWGIIRKSTPSLLPLSTLFSSVLLLDNQPIGITWRARQACMWLYICSCV